MSLEFVIALGCTVYKSCLLGVNKCVRGAPTEVRARISRRGKWWKCCLAMEELDSRFGLRA